MLSVEAFKQLVQFAPLFAIDLVVLNEKNQLLLGWRKNAPAKGYWFVPGGRVFKNESLSDAFTRISNNELGQPFDYQSATLLGLYDHFYSDSVFSENISTHYINAPHLIRITSDSLLFLPSDQHQDYRWADIDTINQDETVHSYSKVFLDHLYCLTQA